MDYDEYIREALADGVTQEAAELELAETVHAHMNELAKNATAQYEMALEERCRQQGQRFVENRPAAEGFPLELFTANIKANKLDDNKWVATIKDYLLRHMPPATHDVPPPPAEGDSESHQIMHRVVSIDKEIDKTQPLKKNIPEDAQLFVPLIPVAYFIGVAVAGLVTQTVGGIAYARYQQSKRRPPAVQPPIVILPPQTTPGQPARPGQPGDPPPPPHPPQPEERDRERKRKRDRKRGRDVVRKARSDCFFGYVDRIDKLKHGYEVRVEAITENSLSDELFIRAVEKMSVAAGSPGFGRYRLALVWIYLHAVPPGVTEGTWINFKLNQQNKQLVTKQNFNLEQPFKDGMTRLELLEPRLSFRMFRFESYFEDNHGYVVQTEVQTISKDIAASVVTTLQQAFGSFNAVGEAVRDLVQKIVHSDTSGKGYLQHLDDDDNKTTESEVQPPKPAAPMVSAAKVPFFSPATVDDILGALLPNKADIIAYHVYDVGQGHSARAFDKYGAAFANDFGYGKLDDEDKKVCYHMIRGQAAVPILLSHWDADHYRIGKSSHAKDFSGSADDITLRPWIAPGRSHITGTVSNETAWLIQQNGNLHQWTDSVDYVQMKNVTVVRCMRNNQFNYPDKNNFGALALFVGKGDNLLLFPGDANFESIPEISSADGLVRSVIATHHGSTRSLGTGTKMGASIPKASSSGETYAVFSYSQGNSYGHDIANAYPYYEKKGYGEPETTARLGVDGNDTLELAHFGTGWDKKKASPIKFHFRNNQLNASTISFADNQLSGVVAAEEEAMDEQCLDSGEPAPAAGPAIRGSKLPEPPSDWQAQAHNTPAAKLHDKYQRSFPEVITLTGSGGADPNHDDLADYAIKDADGDVVFYDITAAKVVMDKLPLNVPCKTDYPVTVQITCQDIELVHDAANKEAILPLVRFNVASGHPSDHPASPGTNGMQGDAGYAGGRLRLAVAGEWLGTTQVLTSPVMGVSVQYRGGHGGNGQKGGAETQPKSGGLVVILEPVKGSLDGSGDGGDAGEPGTVPDSEILAVAGKWPQGWKVQLDLGQPGTDSEFGRPGAVGKGGGFSIDMGGDFMPSDKFMFHGTKFSGADGKPFDRSKAQFLKAQAKLTMVATESEMLSLMAPVDWRYLS